MKKEQIPIAQAINRPVIDFIKTKLEIFNRLDENNRLRNADPELKNSFPRMGGSIKTTVEMLVKLLIKKFKQGMINSQQLSFTYSYFIKHIDGRLKKTAIKEHLIRLCDNYKSILSKRFRGLLKLPSRTINCVTIEFAPGIIQYVQPVYNEMSAMDVRPFRLDMTPVGKIRQQPGNKPAADDRVGKTQKFSEGLPDIFKAT